MYESRKKNCKNITYLTYCHIGLYELSCATVVHALIHIPLHILHIYKVLIRHENYCEVKFEVKFERQVGHLSHVKAKRFCKCIGFHVNFQNLLIFTTNLILQAQLRTKFCVTIPHLQINSNHH